MNDGAKLGLVVGSGLLLGGGVYWFFLRPKIAQAAMPAASSAKKIPAPAPTSWTTPKTPAAPVSTQIEREPGSSYTPASYTPPTASKISTSVATPVPVKGEVIQTRQYQDSNRYYWTIIISYLNGRFLCTANLNQQNELYGKPSPLTGSGTDIEDAMNEARSLIERFATNKAEGGVIESMKTAFGQ